jgi:hypothetical protein
VTFTLRATEECLVGSYQGLTLDLSVIEDGQTGSADCAVRVTLRVDAERGVAARRQGNPFVGSGSTSTIPIRFPVHWKTFCLGGEQTWFAGRSL